jgi:transcriptional regulator with XRE-family HTH domain
MGAPRKRERPLAFIRSQFNAIVRDLLMEERKKAGLTQTQFARMVGMKQSSLSKLDNGHRYLGIDDFVVLARKLGVDPPALLAKAIEQAEAGVSVQRRKARSVTRKATKPR